FNYRYADLEAAHVFVGVQVQSREEITQLLSTLHDHGLDALDFSDNEIAKLHIRHLVGGHAPQAKHEILYRFEFPERPGALINFLQSMSPNWNISLFHYRNHGTDIGRVLVGIQVPPDDRGVFQEFLHKLGYVYCEETQNPAYRLFLS
ncbi:MAG: threonine ammonia-lyase, biosynthetic, partial [Candidatus Tectomicrobia bacterium]